MSDPITVTEYVTEYVWPEDENADEPIRREVDQREHNCTPDMFDIADGRTAVDIAADLIRDAGAWEPSSSPKWQPRTWYASHYEHPYTGAIEESTFHLNGFTDDDARAVYALIVKS